MTAVQSMSTFVFPERPQKVPPVSENSLTTPSETAAPNHTPSFSTSSSEIRADSGFAYSSSSESAYLNLDFVDGAGQTSASSNRNSIDKDDYDSQLVSKHSSASLTYRPKSSIAPEEFNTTLRDESESPPPASTQQPFATIQHPARSRHSRQSWNFNADSAELFDSLNSSNPVQEAYRCLTTPSTLHPSPSLAANSGSYGNGSNQRQSSFSSPSKSFKQQQASQPQPLQKPLRNSQQLPSTLSTPLHTLHPVRTSSPIAPCVPIETLIQLDIKYSSGNSNATDAAIRLTQLLIYNNIVNRLQASTQTFYVNLSDRLKSEPAKFTSSYVQSIDFCTSILNNGFHSRGTHFMSSLKPSTRRLLGSFVGLVKTSPSFICASLSTMSESDISNFFAPSSSDSLDDLTALHRGNALDIIFHSFFPPVAPPSQRFEYFSFIVAFIFDHYHSTEKFDKLCLTIMERIVSLSSVNHLSSLENILYGFLQNGQFLLNSNQPAFSLQSTPSVHPVRLGSPSSHILPCTTSAPATAYPSPEMAAISLAENSPTNVLVPGLGTSNNPISSSISLQRATARPTTSATIHNHNSKASSNSFHLIDAEFESKRLEFLNDAVLQFFSHLNNSSTEAIPAHFIYFSKLVLSKVSQENKEYALHFIFFKHFFNKYIFSLFNSPESLGLASDFYISERQRQRILVVIYELALNYAEIVLNNKPCATTVPLEIQGLLKSIYDKFSDRMSSTPPTANCSTVETDEGLSELGSGGFTQGMDDPIEGTKSSTGQILVLCPSDVLTLYASLFPSFAIQRKASFASHTSGSAKPISVERSGSSTSTHAVNRSSSSSFGFTYAGSAPSYTGGGGSGSGSGGTATSTYPLNESLPSLDEINLYFPDDCESSKTTPIFGPENGLFEWKLNDIRLDIEPVAEELLAKFPYLQFRGPVASQYLHSLRPQKLQHFRLPHPLSEKWQVFRMDEDNIAIGIDEESIVSKSTPFDSLDGGPLKFSKTFEENEHSFPGANSEDQTQYPFLEFEKSPIAPGYRAYAEVVTRSLEQFVSENSASVFNSQRPRNFMAPYQSSTKTSDIFSYITGKPDFSGSIPSMNNQRIFSGGKGPNNGVSYVPPSSPVYLSTILTDAGHRAIASGNFLQGSEYLNAVNALQKLLPPTSSTSYAQVANDVNSYLIKCLKREKEKKLRNITHRLNKCEEIAQPYQIFLQFSCNSCESMLNMLHDLRTKIWYLTEVRTNPIWSRAKDVAVALNRVASGSGSSSDTAGSQGRSHTLKRNSSTTSLSSSGAFSSFKRFTGGSKRDYQNKRHSMSHVATNSSDGMFAPVEYAGPNKLSDREAEATKKWLDGQQVQNFCTGEERIHRFSCEVDDLVKRVIGDALTGRKNRGQSLLTSSALFRGDLWKMIVELEGLDRSSGATNSVVGQYPSKAAFHNFGSGGTGSTALEVESDAFNRRRSTDCISMEGFNPSHMRPKTSGSNHSDLGRSYSLRGHKSRKSSPNLIDMFTSSLDLSSKRMSISDVHLDPSYDRPSSSNDHLGHRRNRSLNEVTGSSVHGNASFLGSDDLGIPAFTDEANRQEHDKKRQELDQFLLDLQMRVTSFIYTDLGLEGWSEGEYDEFFFSW